MYVGTCLSSKIVSHISVVLCDRLRKESDKHSTSPIIIMICYRGKNPVSREITSAVCSEYLLKLFKCCKNFNELGNKPTHYSRSLTI